MKGHRLDIDKYLLALKRLDRAKDRLESCENDYLDNIDDYDKYCHLTSLTYYGYIALRGCRYEKMVFVHKGDIDKVSGNVFIEGESLEINNGVGTWTECDRMTFPLTSDSIGLSWTTDNQKGFRLNDSDWSSMLYRLLRCEKIYHN